MTRTTRSFIFLLAALALLLLMTKAFFLDIVVVRGSSMEPTLKEGTPILVNKLAFGFADPFTGAYLVRWRDPARGEIIVFQSPQDDLPTIKRCFAVPGDTLVVGDHEIEFAGRRLPLKYYQEGLVAPAFTVPADTVFAVGDNASASVDSRTFGPVADDRVSAGMLLPPPPPEAAP